ncbi:MAG: hypothetical protein KGI97_01280 [Alphaproteobacteria bacterium]|nr:hypothetical protein [Alphaproteobacteria bacterium]
MDVAAHTTCIAHADRVEVIYDNSPIGSMRGVIAKVTPPPAPRGQTRPTDDPLGRKVFIGFENFVDEQNRPISVDIGKGNGPDAPMKLDPRISSSQAKEDFPDIKRIIGKCLPLVQRTSTPKL